jgi:hypothetical protein
MKIRERRRMIFRGGGKNSRNRENFNKKKPSRKENNGFSERNEGNKKTIGIFKKNNTREFSR